MNGCRPPRLPGARPLRFWPVQSGEDDGTRACFSALGLGAPALCQAKTLVEALVFDLLFRALAFAQLRGALFFAAPEADPIFLGSGLGVGAPALLAILVEVEDHRV